MDSEQLLSFVGDGRRATQAGELTPADTAELSSLLGMTDPVEQSVRSMEDLPKVSRLARERNSGAMRSAATR
ncbi:MAG: hypothetical protein M0T77_12860 [Actinomycetota bacterium]|nr:hypothetical protein [Actinomycetota bacterium]